MRTNEQRHIDNIADKGVRNRKDLDVFFNQYYAVFVSFACRYCLNEEEARDIVQDVFVSFWEQRMNFTSILTIKAFFYRSISNRILNYLRHEEVKSRYAESQLKKIQSEEFILESVIREEVSCMIHKKIKELTPREQEVILLSLQNKSNQEIADLLSLSVPTVKTHKMHAYARLRAAREELIFLLLIL